MEPKISMPKLDKPTTIINIIGTTNNLRLKLNSSTRLNAKKVK